MSANLNTPERDELYPFLSEVAAMRRRARRHIERSGADSASAQGTVLRLLNEALATERVCVSRYRSHAALASDAVADTVRGEFLKYAREEQSHADLLAERILQLGGAPVAPAPEVPVSELAATDCLEGEALADMLEEDLIAERIAIESYREIMEYVAANDPPTRQLLEAILAVELTHAGELAGMRAELLRRERLAGGGTSTRLPVLEPAIDW